MRRIKLLSDWNGNRAGEVIFVTPNEAHGLIDSGKAKLTKDMTTADIKIKVEEVKDNGRSVSIRPHILK